MPIHESAQRSFPNRLHENKSSVVSAFQQQKLLRFGGGLKQSLAMPVRDDFVLWAVGDKNRAGYDRVLFREKCDNVFHLMLDYASHGRRWAA